MSIKFKKMYRSELVLTIKADNAFLLLNRLSQIPEARGLLANS
jgi:hypothetical protein